MKSAIVRLNLKTGKVDARSSVGIGADVLAIDFEADRLYVACESRIVAAFDINNGRFEKVGRRFMHGLITSSRASAFAPQILSACERLLTPRAAYCPASAASTRPFDAWQFAPLDMK